MVSASGGQLLIFGPRVLHMCQRNLGRADMGRKRLILGQRRVPLSVLIAPATRVRLHAVLDVAEGSWSLGGVVDAAIQIAEAKLMEAADERLPVIVALTARIERNLGMVSET